MSPAHRTTTAHADTAHPRAARPTSAAAIISGIALVCTLIIGLDAWRTWTARDTEIAGEKIATANLARSLAQHAHDMLDTADTLLVSLRETVEAEGAFPSRRPRLTRLLASQIATVPMMRDIMIFDPDAFRIVNTGRPAPPIENIADRVYFQHHATTPGREVFLGPPVQGKLDGTWIITLSRRIDRPDGSFGGVVAATFPIAAFRQFYETFDVGKQGFIGLNTTEGVIITRYPIAKAHIGQNIAAAIVYTAQLASDSLGNWQSVSPIDGIDHLGSYRRVDSYPLVVVVGRGVDEVLTRWRTDALIHLAISLGAAAVIALLGFRFTRQLRLQHQAETDLRRRERQYRLLADNSTDLIVQLDPALRHVYASPASQGLLGYLPSEMLHAPTRQFVHPDDWAAVAQYLSVVARVGTAPPVTYRARRRDGSEIWVEACGRRLDHDHGLVLVKRDITQRRSAELQLRHAQRMEAVGQLTAGVAHDFNNLLQAQLGALEFLLLEVEDQPKATYFATMALGAAEHAAKLTHSLLSFSRQQVLDPKPVPVPALLARLETILSRTLGPRIAVQFELEDGIPPLFADPAQTEAALLNLALNARDAMPGGGHLTIQASSTEAALNPPEAIRATEHILIAVSDDGAGMTPETLAQACEPFFTTKNVGEGSGLGLSMVQGFVRQSGGALRFQSVLGHGTRIELWLPVAPADIIPLPAHPQTRTQGAGRILLVDDVPEVLTIMTEILGNAGFEVVPAPSGEAALQQLDSPARFDALVTDFAMPGIDGAELVRRTQQTHPALPIIVITGYAESDKLLTLPPAVTVLRKPLSGEALAANLCDLIEIGARRTDERSHHPLPHMLPRNNNHPLPVTGCS